MKRRILVTGGCGFVGSHVVSRLCDRMPHSVGGGVEFDINEQDPTVEEVIVHDDFSSCWMDEVDGMTPKFLDHRARLLDYMEDEPISTCGEIDTLVHLALRWPHEREKAVFEKSFEDFVVQGLNLALGFSYFKKLTRVIVGSTDKIYTHTGRSRNPTAALAGALRQALRYWHRPPSLGVYFVHMPELEGERRLPESEFEEDAKRYPVEIAVEAISDLADGTSRHRKDPDVRLTPGGWENA